MSGSFTRPAESRLVHEWTCNCKRWCRPDRFLDMCCLRLMPRDIALNTAVVVVPILSGFGDGGEEWRHCGFKER